jgi:hypothetical protein
MGTKSHPDSELGRQIRAAFRRSGLSIKALSVQSGTPYATTHGVVTGTRDPSLSSASRLCRVLGLELRPVRRGRQTR